MTSCLVICLRDINKNYIETQKCPIQENEIVCQNHCFSSYMRKIYIRNWIILAL